ncbi:amino acid ABC transporter permease [Actinobacteria bacterium YIM 96077]|uniref:Amino acid ABC transporter permease n=1 Tax=Phytoactinopolyspora halophila TaxID=1981511 RepID=A0A329QT27_9ACTN|nr:amino acid ABC transporter permease [Phytoactinopolyspora halophila]AYY14970.1 amino acid ABC transporter permease [Actinobacteria bacterium YIM 96077]RAW15427.1 amino acid ABC transporter permease [Phytoactinopolyspora halophila]
MSDTNVPTSEYRPQASEQPPTRTTSPREWVRLNLFNTWYNSLLTVVLAPLVGYVIYRALRFVFVTARWEIIEVNLTNFMVGTFPRGELWRVWGAIIILGLVIGLGLGVTSRASAETARARGVAAGTSWSLVARRAAPALLLLVALVVFVRTATPLLLLAAALAVAAGGYVAGRWIPPQHRRWMHIAVVAGLAGSYVVMTQFGGVNLAHWGGLMLTVFLAVGGIALAFPVGIIVALGRRSKLPAIRVVSMLYIELIRGLPLIALLYMGWLILPFLLPIGFPTPGRTWRALIVLLVFTAAYVAEIVRGGLQSIPKGQYEAAQALGLPAWKMMRLVILPQALRNVIPALVGQFISLFKDTSLVLLIALTDLLGVARRVTQQPEFLGQGLHAESLLFVSFIYWVGSYWMSRESQRMEQRLGLGER